MNLGNKYSKFSLNVIHRFLELQQNDIQQSQALPYAKLCKQGFSSYGIS